MTQKNTQETTKTRQTKQDKIAQTLTMRDVAAPAQDAADRILPEAKEMVRANKITIQTEMVSSEQEIWTATFHKTHVVVAKIRSTDTAYKPTPDMATATARREGFRKWICKNATKYGVFYDPVDRRTDANKMPRRYDTDELLMTTAANLVRTDIETWADKIANKLGQKVEVTDITADEILPATTHKMREVSPKYNNGCWAYAFIPVTATMNVNGEEVYATMTCRLVSGQLAKPHGIGDSGYGYHYQGLVSEIARDVAEVANAK